MLEKLDPSRIPEQRNRAVDLADIDEATNSIFDTAALLSQIPTALDSQAAEAYKERYYPLLLDRWSDLVRWLEFLLSGPAGSLHTDIKLLKLIFFSCYILTCVLQGAIEGNTYLEDICTTRCTIKLLFLLLCKRKDEPSHQLYYVPFYEKRRGLCGAAKCFSDYTATTFGLKAIEDYLASVPDQKRTNIMKSLVSRGAETISRTGSLQDNRGDFDGDILISLSYMLIGLAPLLPNAVLWAAFVRTGGVSCYVDAFAAMSERGGLCHDVPANFWGLISTGIKIVTRVAVPSPKLVPVLMKKGGLLGCVRRCMIYGNAEATSRAHDVLAAVMPYIYISKVFLAVDAPGEVHKWLQPTNLKTDNATSIAAECERMLQLAASSCQSRRDRHVSYCSNSQVRLTQHSGLLKTYISLMVLKLA